MMELLTLVEGTEFQCTDGNRARLQRALVDSTTKQLRHLAVETQGIESARLVPSSRVQGSADRVMLDCSSLELVAFDPADVPRRVPSTMSAATGGVQERVILSHNVPAGEVEVCAGEEVRAADRRLGRLEGMVVDAQDSSIQRLLVSVGHLFSKRQLSVPASLVTAFDNESVHVAGSKRDLMNRLAA